VVDLISFLPAFLPDLAAFLLQSIIHDLPRGTPYPGLVEFSVNQDFATVKLGMQVGDELALVSSLNL